MNLYCTPEGGKAIRIYWLTSNVLAAFCAVCAAGYWAWTLAHPAQTNAESWRNARLLIGGLALVGLLVANAIVADVIALLKGLPRAWAGGLLAAWVLLAAAVAAWALRR